MSAVNWSYCSDGLSLSSGWRSPNTHPCDIRSNFSSTSNSRAVDKESNSGVLFISMCTPLLFLLNLPCHVFFYFPWNVLRNLLSGWTLQVIRRMQQGFTSFLRPYMAGKQIFFLNLLSHCCCFSVFFFCPLWTQHTSLAVLLFLFCQKNVANRHLVKALNKRERLCDNM